MNDFPILRKCEGPLFYAIGVMPKGIMQRLCIERTPFDALQDIRGSRGPQHIS